MEKLIDIMSEQVAPYLDLLIKDKSTRKNRNIIWATDTYEAYGSDFCDKNQITSQILLWKPDIIKPRILKSFEDQQARTRKKAEVFTPAWLCNQMNNYCDEAWFGRKDVFNISNEDHSWTVVDDVIKFPKRKKWQQYVDSRRLEITCGEAPYLVSRYDVSTGETILPLKRRIGQLDRKLRIVNENTDSYDEWVMWTIRAFEASYGYEYQGDNILIARINLLLTFFDYYRERWEKEPDKKLVKTIVRRIVWNIWQMDGLKDTVPLGKPYEEFHQMTLDDLFSKTSEQAEDETEDKIKGRTKDKTGSKAENNAKNNAEATPCKVCDWRKENSITLKQVKGDIRMGKKKLFDFVIGNPPYQEDTDGAGRQAKPVYNLFIDEIRKIQPGCMCLITPSRWFAGGMGLDKFRASMMNDSHLKAIVDFTNAKDCFPNISISGGVNYFIWQSEYNGMCSFTNTTNGETTTRVRQLNEFPVLVRYNHAVDIIHKAMDGANNNLSLIASGLMPFGLSTSYRGEKNRSEDKKLTLYASNGKTYIAENEVNKGTEYINTFSVMVSKTSAEHAGEPSKDGKFRVIPSSMCVKKPGEVCTHSYFLIGSYKDRILADNLLKYMKTKFVRFLILMSMSGFGLSKLVLNFVPIQNFELSSDIDWSESIREINIQLYNKYRLNEDEIGFIENTIKEMA